MKKYDVLVIGELNVDLILNQMQAFPAMGKEVLADQMTVTLGSSSAIFASNLSSLGNKVALLGKIGKDLFGELVLQSLQSKGVNTNLIIRSDALNTGATIVMNFGEDRAMVTYPGAMHHLSLQDISVKQLEQARHLHVSSCFLQPGLQKDLPLLFREAKAAGLTTSFDAQWDPEEKWNLDLSSILPFVDVFLPNETELLKLTGKTNVESAIDTIKMSGHLIVVKRGNKGSLAWHQGRLIQQQAFLNKAVVDAIGAGDSFNAGFIHKFIRKAPVEVCQRFGNLTGAISTTAAGGTTAFTDDQTIYTIAKERFRYLEK